MTMLHDPLVLALVLGLGLLGLVWMLWGRKQ